MTKNYESLENETDPSFVTSIIITLNIENWLLLENMGPIGKIYLILYNNRIQILNSIVIVRGFVFILIQWYILSFNGQKPNKTN